MSILAIEIIYTKKEENIQTVFCKGKRHSGTRFKTVTFSVIVAKTVHVGTEIWEMRLIPVRNHAKRTKLKPYIVKNFKLTRYFSS